MGAAEHDSRVRDFSLRVWNERYYAAAGRLYADTFSNPAAPGVSGAAAKTMVIRPYHQAFPDLAVTIEDLVAADRVVAVRYAAAGTDLGGFRGKPPDRWPHERSCRSAYEYARGRPVTMSSQT